MRSIITTFSCGLLALALLTGCLEQLQTTRLPAGALSNFLLHLYIGQLDDARTYFAPGLVERSPELDASIEEAADRLRRYNFETDKKASREEDLPNGEKRVTLVGRVRPITPRGQPTPQAGGWLETPIITARMVERGPGWRILEFELECCPAQDEGR